MITQALVNNLAEIALRSLNQAVPQSPESAGGPALPYACNPWRSNGFSDSSIYQLHSQFGQFAIRSWPDRFDSPSKVAFWCGANQSFEEHGEELTWVGARNALPFPRLYHWHIESANSGFLLRFEDRLWSLCDWVQGQSVQPNQVNASLVRHFATVLARLHMRSSTAIDQNGVQLGKQLIQSISIRERLEAIQSLDYRTFAAIDQTQFFAANQLSEKVKHCIAIVLERRKDWERFLAICQSQKRVCHWIVRDLWRDNILVDESLRFSSIVDLGAARLDWPGLDFIRLFGSLGYDPISNLDVTENQQRDLWIDAYFAYVQEYPGHAIPSLDECRMLHLVSNGLSILQWVLWIRAGTISGKNPATIQRIHQRIKELSDQFLMSTDC